jgi:cold shock CspA family protein
MPDAFDSDGYRWVRPPNTFDGSIKTLYESGELRVRSAGSKNVWVHSNDFSDFDQPKLKPGVRVRITSGLRDHRAGQRQRVVICEVVDG